MKTAVSLPDPLFFAADELATRLGMARSELYAKALARFLEEHRYSKVRESIDRICERESTSLDPLLVRLQALSLPPEEGRALMNDST